MASCTMSMFSICLFQKPGAFYVMDRAYLDFERLYVLHQASSFFVTRAKSNLDARRLYSASADRTTGVICDQTIVLNGFYSSRQLSGSSTTHPLQRRRVRQNIAVSHQSPYLASIDHMCTLQEPLADRIVLQMDQAASPYKTFLRNFRKRRQISNLDRGFVYVLIAIIKKKLNLDASLYTLLQILSVTIFEKMPLQQAFQENGTALNTMENRNQLNLYDS